MHNEDYIASGILELYAAGGLSESEREEVEQRAAASEEIRSALDEACAAMEAYAGLHAVSPRPALKEKIMLRFEQPAVQQISETNEIPVRKLEPVEEVQENGTYKWLLAASVTLFLLSGFLSLHFYSKWQQAEQRLATVAASEQRMAQNFQNTSTKLEQQNQLLAILRNPAFKPVKLMGVEAHPDASMLVFWNPDQEKVYIDGVALPQAPSGKQYQLWALLDGKPIDAGMIENAENIENLQQMKAIGAAQAFAVTLEPVGGSVSPTLDQLVVMGNVSS